MKNLFDERGKFLPEGRELLKELGKAVRPVMESYADAGYSMREVSHIAQLAVSDFESVFILKTGLKASSYTVEESKADLREQISEVVDRLNYLRGKYDSML